MARIVVLAPGVDPVSAVPLADGAVVAVGTSGEAVTPLVAALPDPRRGVGLHIVPAYGGQALVEVVAAETTDPATVDALGAFLGLLGLAWIATEDRPGFLVHRIVLPYLNQAITALDDGIATADDIDLSVVLGLGYPVGPLGLLDVLGLDVHHAVTTAVAGELGDPHYLPPPLLTRKVQAGAVGRAAGRGFHTYEEAR